MRTIGTVVRGVRAPIIRQGDNIAKVAAASVMEAWKEAGITPCDRDIVAVTESVVARAQGNYASVAQIAEDVRRKTGGGTVGVAFPILSRNRFSLLLRGMAAGCRKIVLLLSYPSDEVGNHLVDWDKLDEAGINPYSDVLTLEQFREAFGHIVHPFTGVDYIDFYSDLIRGEGCEVEVLFGNKVTTLLDYTDTVITCDIHTRARSKRLLKAAGAKTVLGLDDILNTSVDGSGWNDTYGLLGSNKATEDTVKLFPRDCTAVAEELSQILSDASGKRIEAMVYGDGAFKDPVGKIWELADPVVSPGYTVGLIGTPNELKLKYLADNEFGDLSGDELRAAIEAKIRAKTGDSLVGNMVSEGTTPRRLTDLIGSLCDLTSGSGDKGTPIHNQQRQAESLPLFVYSKTSPLSSRASECPVGMTACFSSFRCGRPQGSPLQLDFRLLCRSASRSAHRHGSFGRFMNRPYRLTRCFSTGVDRMLPLWICGRTLPVTSMANKPSVHTRKQQKNE